MATLTLDIIGNARSAITTLNQVETNAKQTGDKIKGSFKVLAGVIAGAFATDKIVGFFGDSISEARESQKVGAQTAAVIKSTGGAAKVTADQIGDLATAISNKTGIDDEAVQSSANLLLTFTRVRNEVGKGNDVFNQATSIVTDMSVALGTDAKASAIQVGKALNDPIKGVTALTKVGVTFTAQQKDQIKKLVESGNSLGAQKMILGELTKEFGGSAAAQGTAGEKLATTYANLKESVGTALLPVLDKFERMVAVNLTFAMNKVPALFDRATKSLRPFFQAFQSGKAGVSTMSRLGAAARQVALVIAVALRKAFEWFQENGPKILSGLFQSVQDLASVALPLLAEAWEAFRQPVTDLIQFVARNAIPTLTAFTGFLAKHKTVVQAVAVGIGAVVVAMKVYKGIALTVQAVTKAWAAVQGALNGVLAANPIGLVILALAGLTAGLVYAYKHSETFRRIVKEVFGAVADAGRYMWDNVLKPVFNFIGQHWKIMLDILLPGVGLIVTNWERIQSAFRAIGTVMSTVWNNVIKPTFKFLVDTALAVFGAIVHGAASAFGWVPGVGGKLKSARDKFDQFRDQVNGIFDDVNHHAVVKPRINQQALSAVGVQLQSSTQYWSALLNNVGKNAKLPGVNGGAGGGLPGLIGATNAQGTGFFAGGWTKMNELGGEMAYLPGGSTIVPASQTASLIGRGGGGTEVHVHVEGLAVGTAEQVGRVVVTALEAVTRAGVKLNIAQAVQ